MLGQIDSLKTAIATTQGAERLQILYDIANLASNPDEKLVVANQLMRESVSQSSLYYQGLAHHVIGYVKQANGDVAGIIEQHRMAANKFNQIDRLDKVARQMLNLGNRYADIGMYDSAISIYTRGENIAKSVMDTSALYGGCIYQYKYYISR